MRLQISVFEKSVLQLKYFHRFLLPSMDDSSSSGCLWLRLWPVRLTEGGYGTVCICINISTLFVYRVGIKIFIFRSKRRIKHFSK